MSAMDIYITEISKNTEVGKMERRCHDGKVMVFGNQTF